MHFFYAQAAHAFFYAGFFAARYDGDGKPLLHGPLDGKSIFGVSLAKHLAIGINEDGTVGKHSVVIKGEEAYGFQLGGGEGGHESVLS